jgi:ARC6-like, IMS domain
MRINSKVDMVKQLLVYLPISLIWGCVAASPQITTSSPNLTSSSCPSQPTGSLDKNAAKSITLTSEKIKQSGQLTAGKDLAYVFEGKAEQIFAFQTEEGVCVWIYSPSNQLLADGKLPVKGKYIVQVGVPKGSASFNLEMSLEDSQGSFTEQEAVKLVDQWLVAKAKIYAQPFDAQLAESLTTGQVYEEVVKTDGSIDWLKKNNAYYTYGSHSVTSAGKFLSSNNDVQIDVAVKQEMSYFQNGQLKKREDISETYQFSFKLENGIWKISDRQNR